MPEVGAMRTGSKAGSRFGSSRNNKIDNSLQGEAANLRQSLNTIKDRNGGGFSRSIGAKQSRTVFQTRRAPDEPKKQQQQANKDDIWANQASPNRSSLFKKNKETIDEMLVRKLKLKYIDNHTVFMGPAVEDGNTAILLQNNFTATQPHSSRRNLAANFNTMVNSSREDYSDPLLANIKPTRSSSKNQ